MAGRISGCASLDNAITVSHLNGPAFQALAIGIVELEALYAAGKGVGEIDIALVAAIAEHDGIIRSIDHPVIALHGLADIILSWI